MKYGTDVLGWKNRHPGDSELNQLICHERLYPGRGAAFASERCNSSQNSENVDEVLVSR